MSPGAEVSAGRLTVLPGEDGPAGARGSARSLLITILGELVRPVGSPVWTSTLLRVLTGLGIEEQTARQAISRAATGGWIIPERHGRAVSWSLAPKLVRIFDAGTPRVCSLSDPFSSWDRSWLALLTTIPQTLRQTRRPLYAGLTWAGLGNPAPGLWLSPHVERAPEVRDLIDRLDLARHTVSFVGAVTDIGLPEEDIVDRGWNLVALREHYDQLLTSLQIRPRGAEETLLAHVRMISQWQELPARIRSCPRHCCRTGSGDE